MKILAIGNSFSQDATAYLGAISAADGRADRIVNLYIPGCPLADHWENVSRNAQNYQEQVDAVPTGRTLSIAQALDEEAWDVVTLQQASHDSGLEKTYFPYLARMAAFVRNRCPGAKLWVHQTWAYDVGSTHPRFPVYDCSRDKMYAALHAAYAKAAKAVGAPLILCGDAIQRLRGLPQFDAPAGGYSLYRDGFHLSIPYGRYAAAAVWYETLMQGNILQNPFVPDGADSAAVQLLREQIHCFSKQED